MKKARLTKGVRRLLQGRSKGLTLVEIVIAIALIAIIGVAFLGGLSNAMWSLHIADVRTTAESLARTEMERLKSIGYQEELVNPDDYVFESYTIGVTLEEISDDLDGLQQMTVTVTHDQMDEIITLVGYRAKR